MVEAYRTSAIETGLRATSASDVEYRRAGWRANDVNWALEVLDGRAERATDALEFDTARRTDLAAARYNMADDGRLRSKSVPMPGRDDDARHPPTDSPDGSGETVAIRMRV